MAQVVSSENLVEVMSGGGRAPEFVPPEGAKKPDVEVKTETKTNGSEGTTVQPRKADGTFDSPSGEKSPPEKGKAAPQPADDDDPDGENLTEHARRVIGKKHRRMKEAEEFATEEGRRAIRAERRAEELQREIEALRGSTKSGQGPASGSDSGDPEEPKPEDFKTVGEYTKALTKYEVAKAAKSAGEASARQSAEEKQKAQADEAVNGFVTRQQEFMKATPDYEEVIGDSELNVPDAGMQYIVESDLGPQLAYHLAKNPDVVERLSKLTPSRVIAELGKLEARLEDTAKSKADPPKGDPAPQPQRQVSRAPAPIRPLNADAATAVHKDPSQMSFQELRAHREAERRAGKRV